MSEPAKYPRDMTDDELVQLMRQRLTNRSWPISQIIEVERRGIECLASDSELQQAVKEQMDAWYLKHRELIAKAAPDLSGIVAKMNLPALRIPSIQPDWLGSGSGSSVMAKVFNDEAVRSLPLDSQQARHEELVSVLSGGFQATADVMGDVVNGVDTMSKKSAPKWVAYAVLVFTVVAATASVVGVFMMI